MNSRGFRSQLDVFLGPKLNLNQNLTWVTICAYTINLKSKCATPKFQLFPTFFAFSESAHQTEWENAQGAMKSRKIPKMGHPSVKCPCFLKIKSPTGFSYGIYPKNYENAKKNSKT